MPTDSPINQDPIVETTVGNDTDTTIQEQPSDTAPSEAPKPKEINHRARLAFGMALIAELLFLISAMVPAVVSLVMSCLSALLAIASLVVGIMALRRHPRNLAVAAIVLSGVLIIIFVIVAIVYYILAGILNNPAN